MTLLKRYVKKEEMPLLSSDEFKSRLTDEKLEAIIGWYFFFFLILRFTVYFGLK